MITDLLTLSDLEPPMGDLFTNSKLAACRAIWTGPLPQESNAPDRRIIHARVLRLHGRAKLHRLGVRKGKGYHKCGSRQDLDWVTALRMLVFREGRWLPVLNLPDIRKPQDGETASVLNSAASKPPPSPSKCVARVSTTAGPRGISPPPPSPSRASSSDPLGPRHERLLNVAPFDLRKACPPASPPA